MDKQKKILFIVVAAVAVIGLIMSAAFFSAKESERTKRIAVEGELQTALTDNANLQTQLDDVTREREDLKQEVARIEEDANLLRQDLERERTKGKDLSARLNAQEIEMKRISSDLKARTAEATDLKSKLDTARSQFNALSTELEGIKQAKAKIEERLKSFIGKEGVELEKIVVSSEDLVGRVLSVNKKYDFIVTNLGRADGVAAGAVFDIKRDNQVIARVKVEKLHENMSAASMLAEWKVKDVRAGDTVTLSK